MQLRENIEFRRYRVVFFCLVRKAGVRIFPLLTFCDFILSIYCTKNAKLIYRALYWTITLQHEVVLLDTMSWDSAVSVDIDILFTFC